ncbi:MAG: carboxypeptidase regulatory-like domain-containing protein, partial [Eubacterium sp.]|nr:carboxypeptidase regulatory-like domain-containing protein [Eubacterium sp.]
KKVATVTNSGVVTGVAAGTATITAKSVEGTGKSATYKVKVLSADTINLQAVDVRANDCVHVTLNKVKTLTASQFNVMGKRYSFGKYNRTYTVRKIRNYDNKNYDVFLNTDNLIEEDSFVQVTIAALPGNGTKVKEAQAISVSTLVPQDQRWVGVVGDRVEKIIDLSAYCYGTINYQVSGGIVGVTYKQKGNKLVFSGSYGVSGLDGKIDVTATDELGNVVKQRIYVAVGNSKTIAALSTTKVILSGLDVETGAIVEAAGASGAYNYSAGSLPDGLKMNSNGVISGKTTKVGEYNVSVNIVDQTDTSLKTTVTVKLIIEASKKFYGIVKDQNGKVVEGVKVSFYNKEYATTYETTTNAGGYYSMDVPAGTYTIRAEYYDGEKMESYDAVYDVTMTTGARQYDFDVTVETKDK